MSTIVSTFPHIINHFLLAFVYDVVYDLNDTLTLWILILESDWGTEN